MLQGRNEAGYVETLTLEDGYNNKLVVKFIHPPPGDRLQEALEELGKASRERKLKEASKRRNLTLINQISLVVYIECQVKEQCTHRFLFTEDADGRDVITTLKNHELYDKNNVDMLSHGNKLNHPEVFLCAIKAEHIGISTSGSIYSHPDGETIEELFKYKKRKIVTYISIITL